MSHEGKTSQVANNSWGYEDTWHLAGKVEDLAVRV